MFVCVCVSLSIPVEIVPWYHLLFDRNCVLNTHVLGARYLRASSWRRQLSVQLPRRFLWNHVLRRVSWWSGMCVCVFFVIFNWSDWQFDARHYVGQYLFEPRQVCGDERDDVRVRPRLRGSGVWIRVPGLDGAAQSAQSKDLLWLRHVPAASGRQRRRVSLRPRVWPLRSLLPVQLWRGSAREHWGRLQRLSRRAQSVRRPAPLVLITHSPLLFSLHFSCVDGQCLCEKGYYLVVGVCKVTHFYLNFLFFSQFFNLLICLCSKAGARMLAPSIGLLIALLLQALLF